MLYIAILQPKAKYEASHITTVGVFSAESLESAKAQALNREEFTHDFYDVFKRLRVEPLEVGKAYTF